MNFLHDKHSRYYCIFIVTLVLLLFLMGIAVIDTQTTATKEMFLTHNNAIATSLLEEGISKEVIATALMNTEAGTTGNKFLAEIGLSNSMDIENLPYVSAVKNTILTSLFVMLFLWTLLLFLGTMLFLYRRERLYRESENIIKDYIDGNYTVHLPQSNEGTICQLLSSVDQLATMLQAKNDTEQKTKEFLKNTISDISHQLKTPLSALMMYQEIIENEPENFETVKEFSLKIGTALKRMEQLIQSMLKITRIDAGSISFEKSNYSIPNIINHAISELTTRADNEKKEIVIDGDLEQMLYCDIEWTGEAIGNIIKNALDHTDTGGKISISWEQTPAMIRIFITDNGHGISQEDIGKMENTMKKRLSKKTLISVCTLIAALIIWTMWSNTALMLSTVTVSSNRIPAAFNGFRIAQISDLHNAVFGEDNAELLQILSECEPNIIVITGDLVDAEHTDIDVALDFAKEAVQIADTYYVTGNHEASLSQYDELKAELENTGVVVLEDKAMQLEYNGDDITLIGLSDPSFTLKGDMFGEVPAMVDTKLRGLIGDKDNYTILLSHRPELFEAYVNCGVDLVLSGHAHGGQFRLPFIGGLVAPNQGLDELDATSAELKARD